MPNAIISVYDKKNLADLGRELHKFNFNIYATSGTLDYLIKNQIKAFHVSEILDNPSGFENCLSSLGFSTLIGVLTKGTEMERKSMGLNIKTIDVVVYNFYPTWENIKSLEDFNINYVDLGGPTIIKSAAINY